jgi:hypothetical protein
MLITYVCTACGVEFARPSWQATGTNPYCSRACYMAVGHRSPRPSAIKRYLKTCPVCKKQFEAGGQYRKRGLVCCSNSCKMHYREHNGWQECKMISPTDAAYIAGFLDGEGTISLIKRTSGGNSLRVGFAQCEKGLAIFEWIKEITGIQANIIQKRRTNELHANGYTINCHASVAEGLLKQLLPYLILKKPQAELVLDFQEKMRSPEWRGNLDWQAACNAKMHELNKRGNQA